MGLFSDFLLSVAMACMMYHSLLQLRGAEEFRNLVQLSTDSGDKRTLVTYVLDTAQGAGAFPITFGCWVLLATGVIKRLEYHSALFLLSGGIGIRSMIENIRDRARTLVRVNELQQRAGT